MPKIPKEGAITMEKLKTKINTPNKGKEEKKGEGKTEKAEQTVLSGDKLNDMFNIALMRRKEGFENVKKEYEQAYEALKNTHKEEEQGLKSCIEGVCENASTKKCRTDCDIVQMKESAVSGAEGKQEMPVIQQAVKLTKPTFAEIAKKSTVIAGNRSETSPGNRASMKLSFISCKSEEAVPVIETDNKYMNEERWINSNVGQFLGAKLPYMLVKEEAFRLWAKEGLLEVSRTESGFYFFTFDSQENCFQAPEMGPYHIMGRMLVLKKWHRMLAMTKEAGESASMG